MAAESTGLLQRWIGPVRDRRRWFAIVALLFGLGAAWLQGRDERSDVKVSLLLTHAEVDLGDASVDFQRLQDLIIRVPAGEEAAAPAMRRALHFVPGQVPKVTALQELRLPPDVSTLEIGCVFRLGPGASPLRTWTTVQVDPDRVDIQVVDIGRCGALESEARAPTSPAP